MKSKAYIDIIEGFDMVGKTTYMTSRGYIPIIYHANHDLTDSTVGRDSSWVMGYGIIDFLQSFGDRIQNITVAERPIFIDRGVFSSYVYTKLNGNKFDNKILDYYRNNDFFKNCIHHTLLVHESKNTAKVLFELSKNRPVNPNEISAKYDKFDSFEDYWKKYNEAMTLYKEVYDYIGIKPRVVLTGFTPKYSEINYSNLNLLS